MLKNKQHLVKELTNKLNLNVHTAGFCPGSKARTTLYDSLLESKCSSPKKTTNFEVKEKKSPELNFNTA